MKNMSLSQIAIACNGTYYGDSSLSTSEISGVVIDNRLIKDNFLFIPLKGARVDAHQFIDSAIKQGALASLSEHILKDASFPYILVKSCEQALKDLAKYYRQTLSIKVVGITGSVGKTSTKEMIASILEQKYNVLKTAGNFNNEIGLPLTILGIREQHEIAVLEMGISDFGEMHRLADIARPDICVVTNIGASHLEQLKDLDGVLKAKSEMFDYLTSDGTIILNGDDNLLSTLTHIKKQTPLFFGLTTNKDAYATEIINLGLDGLSCHIHLAQGQIVCHIPIPGAHMVYNALAGALVGSALHLSLENIKSGIETLVPLSGRNHMIHANHLHIIDDCYNANPASMKAALGILASAQTRTVALLGDMGELGKDEVNLHFEIGQYSAKTTLDVVCFIGTLAKIMYEGAQSVHSNQTLLYFSTKEDFLKQANTLLHKDDTILVKASHFMEFPELVTALQSIDLKL